MTQSPTGAKAIEPAVGMTESRFGHDEVTNGGVLL